MTVGITSCEHSHTSEYADPLEHVNPFIGTGGHGHTYPGATVPFGMVQLSPDTRLEGWDGCGGYHYSDSLIYGFSHTHLQGTGVSDYGDILFMPTNSGVHEGSNWGERYRSSFKKENESASAGYYSVLLDDHAMKCELTSTQRVGIHRYIPQNEGDSITLFIDMEHRDRLVEYSLYPEDGLIVGHRVSANWAQEQHVYFAAEFSGSFEYQDQTFEYFEEVKENGDSILVQEYVGVFPLVFDPTDTLICKVALSPVSIEGAVKNLRAEAPHWDFDLYHQEARNTWSNELNKIQVKGGADDQLTTFYTALYHSMTVPNIFQDVDGKYRGTDLRVHESPGHEYYTIFSLWDTFRATHPLYTIIERGRTEDFIRTFLKMYEDGGQLPVWELAGNYTGCMIGYHSVPVIVDAHAKGIHGFDHEKALEAMIQAADSVHLGKDHFAQDGFISSEKEHESVSKTLEYAYDDWCIAQFARDHGNMEVYNRFIQRAQYYKNIYNPDHGFMQARRNGGWLEPFVPDEVNFNFTEANSYQYSFFAPQDVSGMIELMGGEEAFCANLDRLFTANSETSGRAQADITGLIGQYAHGNEPSHHMAYLYNYAGQPWKTQEYVRQILDEQYWNGPDGLSGNEDCGQMSSWYVLSAMGIYPVTPGSDIYTFGSPLFDEVRINLENGNTFTIEGWHGDDRHYFEGIKLNQEKYTKLFITSDDIMSGGNLKFSMCDMPHKGFGVEAKDRPVSAIDGKRICTVPVIKAERTFVGGYELELVSTTPGARIEYIIYDDQRTLVEGTYESPLPIDTSCWISVQCFADGYLPSKEIIAYTQEIDGNRSIDLLTEYDNQYTAGGNGALIDQLRGGEDFKTGEWQGYWGKDVEAIVDLGKVQDVSYLGIGVLQDVRPWIMCPSYADFWVSEDGENWTSAGRGENYLPDNDYTPQHGELYADYSGKARYIKVFVKNYGILPEWHLGAGNESWTFVDEIVVR